MIVSDKISLSNKASPRGPIFPLLDRVFTTVQEKISCGEEKSDRSPVCVFINKQKCPCICVCMWVFMHTYVFPNCSYTTIKIKDLLQEGNPYKYVLKIHLKVGHVKMKMKRVMPYHFFLSLETSRILTLI